MSSHGITCGKPPRCPFFRCTSSDGDGECRHRSPLAHRMSYDRNEYRSVWPPVNGYEDFCGNHPALAALVRRGGEVLEDNHDNT